MEALNNYIVERIRIDNVKSKYDFNNPIYIGDVDWKYNVSYVRSKPTRKTNWYAMVLYRSIWSDSMLIFFSPDSNRIFWIHNNGLTNWYVSETKGPITNDPQEFYKMVCDNERYLYKYTETLGIANFIDGGPEVDNIVKEWKNLF